MLFSFPQVLHTLIFVIPAIVGSISFIKSGDDTDYSNESLPSMAAVITRIHTKFFGFAINATLVLILLTSYVFFRWAGNQKPKFSVAVLRFVAFGSAFIAIAGLLGVVGFSHIDDPVFKQVISLMFLMGVSLLHLCHDIILHLVKKTSSIFAWIYDTVLFALVTLHELLTDQDRVSIIEYISYFLVFLKFPIFGSRMYGDTDHLKSM